MSEIIQQNRSIVQLRCKRCRAEALKKCLAITTDCENKILDYTQKITKYADEKTKIEKEAKEQESIRDESKKHSQEFGIAVIFLQIAILLSSIAALLKKKPLWMIGLLSGVVGIIYFVNGFVLFVK